MNLRLLFVLLSLVVVVQAGDRDYRDYRDERDDRDRRGRRPAGRVIVYQHAGFKGGELVLYPGDAIENMSGASFEGGAKLNDSISSIRVEGDVEVFAYENARFRGEALRLTENVRDLTGRLVAGSVGVSWNDRISSIRVEARRGRIPDRGDDDRPRGNPEKIIKDTFNEILGRAPDAGEMREFRTRLVDAGWTERMLRDHLRQEERYRREAAELIVRRAYRDVLDRDADPSGLRQFTRMVMDKGWTEGDVRDELRKSAEYRNKPRR